MNKTKHNNALIYDNGNKTLTLRLHCDNIQFTIYRDGEVQAMWWVNLQMVLKAFREQKGNDWFEYYHRDKNFKACIQQPDKPLNQNFLFFTETDFNDLYDSILEYYKLPARVKVSSMVNNQDMTLNMSLGSVTGNVKVTPNYEIREMASNIVNRVNNDLANRIGL